MSIPAAPIEAKPSGEEEEVCSLKDVSKSYAGGDGEGVVALRGVTLSIKRGEFVMIRGPSGGGKTSLLNVIGTIDHPTRGAMRLFSDKVEFGPAHDGALADLRLRKIGFVFQSFNLLATLSAFENVELPMSILAKLSPALRKARATSLLLRVGLEDRMGHLPSELSGGEQQRVTIARALANSPELLLLDEPTGDLDTANTVSIMDLLLAINREQGTTCVMVTHDANLECYATRILYVADGRFVGQAVNTTQTVSVRASGKGRVQGVAADVWRTHAQCVGKHAAGRRAPHTRAGGRRTRAALTPHLARPLPPRASCARVGRARSRTSVARASTLQAGGCRTYAQAGTVLAPHIRRTSQPSSSVCPSL